MHRKRRTAWRTFAALTLTLPLIGCVTVTADQLPPRQVTAAAPRVHYSPWLKARLADELAAAKAAGKFPCPAEYQAPGCTAWMTWVLDYLHQRDQQGAALKP